MTAEVELDPARLRQELAELAEKRGEVSSSVTELLHPPVPSQDDSCPPWVMLHACNRYRLCHVELIPNLWSPPVRARMYTLHPTLCSASHLSKPQVGERLRSYSGSRGRGRGFQAGRGRIGDRLGPSRDWKSPSAQQGRPHDAPASYPRSNSNSPGCWGSASGSGVAPKWKPDEEQAAADGPLAGRLGSGSNATPLGESSSGRVSGALRPVH